MGLISRVSSRTYRFKNSPKMSDTQENWAEEAPAVEDFPLEEMAMEEAENEPKMFGKCISAKSNAWIWPWLITSNSTNPTVDTLLITALESTKPGSKKLKCTSLNDWLTR